jgi:hypothetical protein
LMAPWDRCPIKVQYPPFFLWDPLFRKGLIYKFSKKNRQKNQQKQTFLGYLEIPLVDGTASVALSYLHIHRKRKTIPRVGGAGSGN